MRYREHLRNRYRALLGYTGFIIMLIGGVTLLPLTIIPFYPQEIVHAPAFLLAGLPFIAFGGLVWRSLTPKQAFSLTIQEGAVVMVVIWITACVVGAIPFMLINGMNFTQAMFESTSGYTTTGLSIVNVVETPRMLLLFRSVTHLAGGAGFAIIAVLAASTSLGMGVSAAEGRADQLAPNVRRSSTIVLSLYLGYIGAGVLALRIAGMGWFDAVNHSIAAVATGGFSTKPESVGHWDSPFIESVLIVLMLLGSINFLIAYTVLRGKPGVLVRSAEVRSQMFIIVVATILVTLITTTAVYGTLADGARVALFEVVSAITSTGFASGNSVIYTGWNDFGLLIIALLMALGGGAGSTSGGIKQLRVYVLYKSAFWEIKRAFLPPHAVNEPVIWQADRSEPLTDKQVRQAAQFVGVYLTLFFIGTAIISAYGYPLAQSMFEFSSALGNAGMSVGITSATASPGILWLLIVAMIFGRLEIFVLIVGLLKLVTDSRDMILPQKQVWATPQNSRTLPPGGGRGG
jgi:trk system potassium uptake protein